MRILIDKYLCRLFVMTVIEHVETDNYAHVHRFNIRVDNLAVNYFDYQYSTYFPSLIHVHGKL